METQSMGLEALFDALRVVPNEWHAVKTFPSSTTANDRAVRLAAWRPKQIRTLVIDATLFAKVMSA